jgi:hypothetical protein
MKKITLITTAVLIAGSIFCTFSCNKATVDSNTTTTSDNELCESEFMRMIPMINCQAVSKLNKSVERVGGIKYPTYTATDTVTNGNGWPRTLVINYGPNPGVADPIDGKTRYGIITVTYNNYWHDIGTTAAITFTNYYVNNINYMAAINITRKSSSQFGLTIVNGVCKNSSATAGWVIQFGSTRIFTQTSGIDDSVIAHSTYMVTGSGYGVDRNAVNFKSAISATGPMTLLCNCQYLITSGSVTITPAGLATRTVNYGIGSCSSSATVTIDGQNYSITK